PQQPHHPHGHPVPPQPYPYNGPPHQGGYPPQGPYPYQPGYPQPAPRRVGLFRRLWRAVGPTATARKVFRPSRPGRVEDAVVDRIQKIRTYVGLGAIAWVTFSYKLVDSASDAASDRLSDSWINVLVLSLTFPVIIGVLVALARPPARQQLLRRAAKPFGSVVAIIGGVAVFPAAIISGLIDGRLAINPVMSVVSWLITVLILVWVLPFILYGMVLSLVHVFRTADIHETVPPLLTMTLVWEMAIIGLFTGAYGNLPGVVRIVFILGAPLSVTAVGLWELRRLRSHYGLTLRGALMR
ncbi:MAG: hypothetical protein QOC85_2383, partial [Streptomyces sp.]|nr:hypothetical protein [Streptomyces sp.]